MSCFDYLRIAWALTLLVFQKARLEIAWGLKPGQFDFNGPLNTIPCKSFLLLYVWRAPNSSTFSVRANWHSLFDKKDWVLLPEVDMLNKILAATAKTLPASGARAAADEGCPLVTEVSPHSSDREHFYFLLLPLPPDFLPKTEWEAYIQGLSIHDPSFRSFGRPDRASSHAFQGWRKVRRAR